MNLMNSAYQPGNLGLTLQDLAAMSEQETLTAVQSISEEFSGEILDLSNSNK